jgi:predicted RNA-binding Zn-ribbon protein involved in translation (DUF1610 family)
MLDRNLLNPQGIRQLSPGEEIIMGCPKCKGLMMLERFSDFFLVFYAWKCVNCGAIIDRTISNNRKNSLAAKAAKEVETAAA